MTTTKHNGPNSREVQPVKTLTKYAPYFIARCAMFASADAGLRVTFAAVLVQTALIALVVLL